MKRVIRIFALLCCLLAVLTPALAEETRVFDQAELLTSSDKQKIEAAIADFQERTGMDFVVLTSWDAHVDSSSEAVADDFYDYGHFGLDAENSGVLYFIDMAERYHHLSTTGAMIDYMTDARIDQAIDDISPYLSSRNYAMAIEKMMEKVESYIRSGIPEGQYRYDIMTGQRLTARHKALTAMELLICGAVALVIGCIVPMGIAARYRLKGSTYRYQFQSNCDMKMTDSDDTFLRTTTTRVRKPDPPSGSGGGFGGGGGGSGVHVGSSGTSHGGGGGRF